MGRKAISFAKKNQVRLLLGQYLNVDSIAHETGLSRRSIYNIKREMIKEMDNRKKVEPTKDNEQQQKPETPEVIIDKMTTRYRTDKIYIINNPLACKIDFGLNEETGYIEIITHDAAKTLHEIAKHLDTIADEIG